MTADVLLALAERVEKEGHSWALVLAIECALNPGAQPFPAAPSRGAPPRMIQDASGTLYSPQAYTASLDAAVTLVPKGAAWFVSSTDGAGVILRGDPVDHEGNRPDCPAAALTAAALRARAALMSKVAA